MAFTGWTTLQVQTNQHWTDQGRIVNSKYEVFLNGPNMR